MHPAVKLLRSLINIDSTSEKELEIGIFLEQHLKQLGYTVERIAITPGSSRYNVYAYLGQQRKARVLITSHMDTVPPHIPFSFEGDLIRGRGACDDLGPLVAQVFAVEEMRAEGKISEDGGDISFLFVVGEEKGGPGMIAANDMGLTWETGIFGEPTEGKLAQGHKGHVVFELSAQGKASHSGYPHLGRSATTGLMRALNDLSAVEWPSSDLLGPTTFNIGKIEGGEGYNIVAASAKALCGVRVAADVEGIKRQISDIAAKHPDVELDILFSYPETLLDWDIEGFEVAPVAYGTDVPRLKGNHKKVLYGPGSILVAHGKDECIRVSEILESIQGYKTLISKALE
ncbi:hypothetical protein M406DRAFT_46663 [Cryphonectria parasitica EP155]|uniref:Peptidase M20 dimerisation domain-containing protein n=1 Tax=Cryphonectria parasitica (strain ATCC 38755 / EP155) TaxID=660469 RepID=A0A9P4XXI7_CRYP1|nr:uncharacterized protein M406DRAFT_46663 [Cryphonectria parasitica EP155]KAF3762595.1 hypothetical protein M406DRAFT_46663 [Cryphonectria parasitica EP155]